MVISGRLYAVVSLGLLLAALAVALPVLKQIVIDGLERQRERKEGEIEQETEEARAEAKKNLRARAEGRSDGAAARRCPHCGAENGTEYTFCRECAQQL